MRLHSRALSGVRRQPSARRSRRRLSTSSSPFGGPASPVISPDGKWVAYTIRETNWEENTYETEIWLADAQTGATRQLTNGRKSSNAPAWSPDGRTLAFGSDREDKRQIYLIDLGGGEALKVTSAEESVGAFAWSPDGRSIAFASSDPRSEALKEREKKYAEFDVIDEDHRMSHLYVVDVETKKIRRLTSGAFTVGRFDWSPDSRQIAFDHRINGDPANSGSADISLVAVSDGALRKLVTRRRPRQQPAVVTRRLADRVRDSMGSPKFFFTNRRIATIPAAGGPIANLSAQFDEDPSIVRWTTSGIFFSAASRAWAYLYRLDPATKTVTRLAPTDNWIGSGFSLSADAQTVAFMASDATTFPEIYVAPTKTMAQKRLTTTGEQVAAWPSAPIEVISWPSQDGATIEGILHKPVGFQAGKRYPLLVVIHGGPTGVSRATPYSSTAIYPIDLWVAKGALVLEPNYRGSAGYGEKFRSLNYRNLGVGDAWDVVSGVDSSGQAGPGRRGPRRRDGLEPGRLHLRVSDDTRQRAVQGRLGGRGDLELDDLLREHRHPSVHAAVPQRDAVGRSRDLREDVADDIHQGCKGADAHPARRD